MANIFWNSSIHAFQLWGTPLLSEGLRAKMEQKRIDEKQFPCANEAYRLPFLAAGDWKRELIQANDLPQSVHLTLI